MDDRSDNPLRSRLVAVDDVARSVPSELRDALTWFYGEILGLHRPAAADDASDSDDVLRFRSERIELRFAFGDTPARKDTGHVVLEVNSLDEVARRFDEHGIAYERTHGFNLTEQRIRAKDPAHHVVILQQTWPF